MVYFQLCISDMILVAIHSFFFRKKAFFARPGFRRSIFGCVLRTHQKKVHTVFGRIKDESR